MKHAFEKVTAELVAAKVVNGDALYAVFEGIKAREHTRKNLFKITGGWIDAEIRRLDREVGKGAFLPSDIRVDVSIVRSKAVFYCPNQDCGRQMVGNGLRMMFCRGKTWGQVEAFLSPQKRCPDCQAMRRKGSSVHCCNTLPPPGKAHGYARHVSVYQDNLLGFDDTEVLTPEHTTRLMLRVLTWIQSAALPHLRPACETVAALNGEIRFDAFIDLMERVVLPKIEDVTHWFAILRWMVMLSEPE